MCNYSNCKSNLIYKGYCKRCGNEICETCSSLINPMIHQKCLNEDKECLPENKTSVPLIPRPYGTIMLEIMSGLIPRPTGIPYNALRDIYDFEFFEKVVLPEIMDKAIEPELQKLGNYADFDRARILEKRNFFNFRRGI